jgi:hypothetical protein
LIFKQIIVLLTSPCVNWAFFGSFHLRFKGPRVLKRAQFTDKRVEDDVFLFDEPLRFKIFKISLTFRFDKLSNLSKSIYTKDSQISKGIFFYDITIRIFFLTKSINKLYLTI